MAYAYTYYATTTTTTSTSTSTLRSLLSSLLDYFTPFIGSESEMLVRVTVHESVCFSDSISNKKK